MTLAIFLDAEGEVLETPIFLLQHLAALFGDESFERLHEPFDLGTGDVLACDEHAFVKRH